MPNVLAIECSGDACSVALCSDNLLQETFIVRPREHNEILLPMVDELMRSMRLAFSDLDALAFSAGPGSFTGLRLAAGVVQGLAFALDKPVIPVSSLAVFAHSALEHGGIASPATVLVAVDARMQEVYLGIYQYANGKLCAVAKDSLVAISGIDQCLRDHPDAVMAGDGWSLLPTVLPEQGAASIHCYPRAASVLYWAKEAFLAGNVLPAEQALPVYLRDSVSWQKWRPKRDQLAKPPVA